MIYTGGGVNVFVASILRSMLATFVGAAFVVSVVSIGNTGNRTNKRSCHAPLYFLLLLSLLLQLFVVALLRVFCNAAFLALGS